MKTEVDSRFLSSIGDYYRSLAPQLWSVIDEEISIKESEIFRYSSTEDFSRALIVVSGLAIVLMAPPIPFLKVEPFGRSISSSTIENFVEFFSWRVAQTVNHRRRTMTRMTKNHWNTTNIYHSKGKIGTNERMIIACCCSASSFSIMDWSIHISWWLSRSSRESSILSSPLFLVSFSESLPLPV